MLYIEKSEVEAASPKISEDGPALLSEPILTDQLVAYFGMRPFTIYGSEDKN